MWFDWNVIEEEKSVQNITEESQYCGNEKLSHFFTLQGSCWEFNCWALKSWPFYYLPSYSLTYIINEAAVKLLLILKLTFFCSCFTNWTYFPLLPQIFFWNKWLLGQNSQDQPPAGHKLNPDF
jgi:hypothetical protein